MNIVNPRLKFTEPLTPLNLNKVDSIALHHMAHQSADIIEIHRWHLAQGWLGIGYGYWISKSGIIYEGRGLNVNAGVENQNGHVISIGFQGNYDVENNMSKEQFESGVELIAYLKNRVPNIKYIDGHCRWNPTTCPGRYFPLKQMIDAKFDIQQEAIGLNEAIDILSKTRNNDDFIINTPTIWKSMFVKKELNIDYARALIIKIAKYIKIKEGMG